MTPVTPILIPPFSTIAYSGQIRLPETSNTLADTTFTSGWAA